MLCAHRIVLYTYLCYITYLHINVYISCVNERLTRIGKASVDDRQLTVKSTLICGTECFFIAHSSNTQKHKDGDYIYKNGRQGCDNERIRIMMFYVFICIATCIMYRIYSYIIYRYLHKSMRRHFWGYYFNLAELYDKGQCNIVYVFVVYVK